MAVGRVFIGGGPEAGLRFGAFSIIQHTLSPYSKLQMLSVCCFDEFVPWWNKEGVSE